MFVPATAPRAGLSRVLVEVLESRRMFSAAPATVVTPPALAPILNGGFEDAAALNNWGVDGNATTHGVEYLAAPEGQQQAVLSTGPGIGGTGTPDTAANIESFLSLNSGTLTKQGNGAAVSGTAIKQTITTRGFQILSFKADYLTNETAKQDFAFVTLTNDHGQTRFFKIRPQVHATSNMVSGATGEASESGYRTYFLLIPRSGTWTLGFGVVNTVNAQILSSLALDSIQVAPLFGSGFGFGDRDGGHDGHDGHNGGNSLIGNAWNGLFPTTSTHDNSIGDIFNADN